MQEESILKYYFIDFNYIITIVLFCNFNNAKEKNMINPGTAGLAVLLNKKEDKSSIKTSILKLVVCHGCSFSPLS